MSVQILQKSGIYINHDYWGRVLQVEICTRDSKLKMGSHNSWCVNTIAYIKDLFGMDQVCLWMFLIGPKFLQGFYQMVNVNNSFSVKICLIKIDLVDFLMLKRSLEVQTRNICERWANRNDVWGLAVGPKIESIISSNDASLALLIYIIGTLNDNCVHLARHFCLENGRVVFSLQGFLVHGLTSCSKNCFDYKQK